MYSIPYNAALYGALVSCRNLAKTAHRIDFKSLFYSGIFFAFLLWITPQTSELRRQGRMGRHGKRRKKDETKRFFCAMGQTPAVEHGAAFGLLGGDSELCNER